MKIENTLRFKIEATQEQKTFILHRCIDMIRNQQPKHKKVIDRYLTLAKSCSNKEYIEFFEVFPKIKNG